MARLPESTLKSTYSPRQKRSYVIVVLVILLVLFIVFEYTTNGIVVQSFDSFLHYNFSSLNSYSNINTSSAPTTIPVNGTLIFCINRGIFRTSNSRGLNQSQVQTLVNYCEYYGYSPGIVNDTNYTAICHAVNQCQNGGFPICSATFQCS